MIGRLGRLLSFSNVIACLALFIALGGTVYAAGKISGKQIKRSSLPGNRIKPKTIPANRIKPKALTGRQVKPHSLTGAQINQSTLTRVAAVALVGVQYVSETVPIAPYSATGTTATASCPASTYVIGGGATVSNEEAARVNDSGPDPLRTGWTATAAAPYSPGHKMNVTAICIALKEPGSKGSTGTGSTGPSLPGWPEYHPVP